LRAALGFTRHGFAKSKATTPADGHTPPVSLVGWHLAPTPSGNHTMVRTTVHKPSHPNTDVPEEFEPGALPVEPDEGPVPDLIPDDPEHERLVDPAAVRPPVRPPVRPQKGPRRTKAPRSAPGLSLPHERDESPDSAAVAPDPVIAQAKRDIDAGMVDTDMRATPGLDAKLRARLVPGPGGKPPSGR
jgi:hypothetical protein